MKKLISYIFLFMFLLQTHLKAENEAVDRPQDIPENNEYIHADEPDLYPTFWNMLGTLALLVCALLILTWFFKRMTHSKIRQMNKTSPIKVIESRALSTKLSVHFIEVENKGIVFAESANGIAKLAEIPIEEIKETRSFRTILEENEN